MQLRNYLSEKKSLSKAFCVMSWGCQARVVVIATNSLLDRTRYVSQMHMLHNAKCRFRINLYVLY